MITYKDMTFCPYYKQCIDGIECYRALTKKIEIQAEKVHMPVSIFAKEPDCFKEKNTCR